MALQEGRMRRAEVSSDCGLVHGLHLTMSIALRPDAAGKPGASGPLTGAA
jgi:hypothetical protein